jgi:hypothetical protein
VLAEKNEVEEASLKLLKKYQLEKNNELDQSVTAPIFPTSVKFPRKYKKLRPISNLTFMGLNTFPPSP